MTDAELIRGLMTLARSFAADYPRCSIVMEKAAKRLEELVPKENQNTQPKDSNEKVT